MCLIVCDEVLCQMFEFVYDVVVHWHFEIEWVVIDMWPKMHAVYYHESLFRMKGITVSFVNLIVLLFGIGQSVLG